MLILLIVLAVGFLVINQRRSKSEEIKTVKPTIKDISQTVSASGKVKSDEEVSLSFQTLGQLAWVGVKEQNLTTTKKLTKWF